jgi:formate hydrogenlyase subunit 4
MLEFVLAACLVVIAILFSGIQRKMIAKMHNRIGPPLIQPFFDILKLFSKEMTPYANPVFNIVPIVSIATAFLILLFVAAALLGTESMFIFDYDFLVLCYLFILLDTFYIFGAVASRSPFAIHSSMRKLLLMLGYELSFLMVVSVFFAKAGIVTLAGFWPESMFMTLPLASILLVLVGFVIIRITPFDVVNAESEISAGFFAEYYGRDLALLEIAEFSKDFAFFLMAGILIFGRVWALPAALCFAFFYMLMQASSPRYCTFRTAKIFLAIALLALIDLFVMV